MRAGPGWRPRLPPAAEPPPVAAPRSPPAAAASPAAAAADTHAAATARAGRFRPPAPAPAHPECGRPRSSESDCPAARSVQPPASRRRAGDGGNAGRAPARMRPATRQIPAAPRAHICATAAAAASPSPRPAAACVQSDERGWPGDAPKAEDGAAPGARRSPGQRCGCPAEQSAGPGRPPPSLSVRRPPLPASARQNACQELVRLPVSRPPNQAIAGNRAQRIGH